MGGGVSITRILIFIIFTPPSITLLSFCHCSRMSQGCWYQESRSVIFSKSTMKCPLRSPTSLPVSTPILCKRIREFLIVLEALFLESFCNSLQEQSIRSLPRTILPYFLPWLHRPITTSQSVVLGLLILGLM